MIETVMVFKHKHTQMLAGNVQVTSLEACMSKLIHNQHSSLSTGIKDLVNGRPQNRLHVLAAPLSKELWCTDGGEAIKAQTERAIEEARLLLMTLGE